MLFTRIVFQCKQIMFLMHNPDNNDIEQLHTTTKEFYEKFVLTLKTIKIYSEDMKNNQSLIIRVSCIKIHMIHFIF